MTTTLRRLLPLLLGATLLVGAGPSLGAIPAPEVPPLPEVDVPNPFPLGTCVKLGPLKDGYTCVIIDPRDTDATLDGAVPA